MSKFVPPSSLYFDVPLTDDGDPLETTEWLEALESLMDSSGPDRALFLLNRLAEQANAHGVKSLRRRITPYCNSIDVRDQPAYPGNIALEDKLNSILRWNALAMVVRANRAYGELGGHIASYASAADLFEVGFNHFFKGDTEQALGDLVFFQPHSAPGIYARAYLEGFLDDEQLGNYRQEIRGRGLCSYPHPWLMPDFWQFPTGSMGIGPINAIFQARFMRYLENRQLQPASDRHIWGVFGDGEMDEPESIGALSLAAREQLDNLTFVINCNLQRLDGPVRGNGRIIDELEGLFEGAGWNVIKVVWGSDWDSLFAHDNGKALLKAFANTVDGQFQTFSANDGAYNRQHFFNQNPELAQLAAHLSDADIDKLRRGGHDVKKLHAAYAAARAHKGQPTVILAKTMKGYGLGALGQGRMTTHQHKKLEAADLLAFRDRFQVPLSDEQAQNLEFYRPAADAPEMIYLHARRAELGGYLPRRRRVATHALAAPALDNWAKFALEADGKEMSTTMAVVRMFTALMKDKSLGKHIVPIVADEARTFGMANMFRQVGIYAPHGQLYEPEDMGSVLYYRESSDGQILEEGISEASAISSWVAAATSYSVNNVPMLPFYIYYSMFGFQRVGDLIWAAADQRARGFLIGATSGKTTLGGEGLQHQDGTSHLVASTVPNCKSYDPSLAYELAVIVEHGMQEMLEEQTDVFYYITVMNENTSHPSMPVNVQNELRQAIIAGGYRLKGAETAQVHLLGSGTILGEIQAAAQLLSQDWGLDAAVYSVTSYTELQRQALVCERQARYDGVQQESHIASLFADTTGPVIAATDYVRALPELVRGFIPNTYVTLGTDGFGRSDTREALRDFFEVDRYAIVIAALRALVDEGSLEASVWREALSQYGGEQHRGTAPWQC